MTELDDLRDEIRDIDSQLLELVQKRNQAARRVGDLKRKQKLPLQNFEVEKSVLDHALGRAAKLGLHEETARSLVRLLIQSALRVQERDPRHFPPKSGRTALVVGGAGLMGQWFCRFLEEQGYEVFVDDPQPSTYPKARFGAKKFDLVVVSTPPSNVPTILEHAAENLDKKSLLVDIASVKGESVQLLHRLAKSGKRVASLHPMFGPSTDLLMGRNVLVLDAGHANAAAEAGRLFAHTAARAFELKLEDHDAFMADVLTLSHATSLAFNYALASGDHSYSELENVASTTFRKQVDVSREVAQENADLYFEIQAFNPASGDALERLEAAARKLRQVIESRNRVKFVDYMATGRRYYGGKS